MPRGFSQVIFCGIGLLVLGIIWSAGCAAQTATGPAVSAKGELPVLLTPGPSTLGASSVPESPPEPTGKTIAKGEPGAPGPEKVAEKEPTPEITPQPPAEKQEPEARKKADIQAIKEPAPGPVIISSVVVETSTPSGASLVVTSDRPMTSYESFSLTDPPRLVIDIPDASHGLKAPVAVPDKEGLIKRVRTSQFREKPTRVVRLVLDLRAHVPYQVEAQKTQLRVVLGEMMGEAPKIERRPEAPKVAEAVTPEKVEVPSKPEAPPVPLPVLEEGQVTRIEFQPLKDRSRVFIATKGKVTFKVAEIAEPPSLVIDVSGAQISTEARKSMDVSRLPGAVAKIRSVQYQTEPNKVVRVVADLKERTTFEVAQTEKGIALDVITPPPKPVEKVEIAKPEVPEAPPVEKKPIEVVEKPVPEVPPAEAPPGRRLSMDFKDAEIDNILRIIAEVSGLNIVAGEDVKGKVTVRLINVPWEQALDVILKINNFGYVRDGNIIRVAPIAKLQAERAEKAKAEAEEARAREAQAAAQVKLEPLTRTVIAVNYAKASDMVKNVDRLKSPRGTITVDDRTNTMIVEDLAKNIENMEALIKRLDVPTPQVQIEARIVEIDTTFTRDLGIMWGGGARVHGKGDFADRFNIFGTYGGASITAPTLTATGPVPVAVNFPASGAPAIGFTYGSVTKAFLLGAQLSLLEKEGKSRILSNPKIVTLDNKEAEIKHGTQIPYTTVDSSGRTVVAFMDAFIRLKVTPHITADRRVSMKVEAEKTDVGEIISYAGGFAYPLNTRKATTELLVSNGATVVIGGLLKTTETVSEQRVPWVHQIPILGWLFKSRSITNPKNELLIFLTPTIIEEGRA